MFFDSHVHFGTMEGPDGTAAVVARATQAGVLRMVAVGGTPEADQAALDAAARFPASVRAAIGMDRDQAAGLATAPALSAAIEALTRRLANGHGTAAVAAIGEIGMDGHYHPTTLEQQEQLLIRQLTVARRFALPVIVHCREAEQRVLAALRSHRDQWPERPDVIGVLHCFTGTAEFASELLKLGYCVSFSGIVTFRNADPLREVARHVPEDRLLIETDSPYLAPVPLRGRRNEPAHLPHVAEMLARIRGCTVQHIAEATWNNATRLFACAQEPSG